ncbi:Uncharacterised protein [uncultured Eubacterium sp.]|nr:Uncharacterised protein [uncultured Eubacterium sp.]
MKMIVEPILVDCKQKCPHYDPPTCRHKCAVY